MATPDKNSKSEKMRLAQRRKERELKHFFASLAALRE
jgi:hypothetical protein